MNRGASLDGHISPTDGGPLRVNDGEGMADGAIATTTGKVCDATTRGERHRVQGVSGVADSWVMCQKTTADTYEWTTVAAAGGPFVLKAGDTMTGSLVLREATDEKASIEDYAADAFGPNIGFKKSRHATPGSHTIVQSGDDLGAVVFYGSDGTNYDVAAYIGAEVDGTPGSGTDMPGRLVFFTSPDGSATPAERLRISQDGGITHAGLAGTGTRVVEASSTGLLSASLAGFATIGPWYFANLPGTATSAFGLEFATAATAVTFVTEDRYMPLAGAVIAGWINSTEARTAGTAILHARKNGSVDTGVAFATLNATNTFRHSTYSASGVSFAAGDQIGASVATVGWTPTTADVNVALLVRWTV
jgi:hypothetical protein